MCTLLGGGDQHGGFDAVDYRKIKQGDADRLGNYPIRVLSVLPDKLAAAVCMHTAVALDLVAGQTWATLRARFKIVVSTALAARPTLHVLGARPQRPVDYYT